MSIAVSTARPAMKASAITSTGMRMGSVDRKTRRNLFSPGGHQSDRRVSEDETADVGEVRHAPAGAAGRVSQSDGAEDRLLDEPDSEHDQRGQFDHGEKEDDE